MEVLKKIGKAFLFIITILLSIILIIDIAVYNVRDITENFISEEKIKEEIANINIMDLLKDNEGNEIKEITEIKNSLVSAGVPVETVESFIDSKPVHDITSKIVTDTVNYIFYDKEPDIKTDFDSKDITNFLRENMRTISKELQDKNVPKSELLTEESQEKILTNIEEQIPVIEESLKKITDEVTTIIKNTDEYKQVEEYQKKLEEVLSIIQLIYSDKVTNIMIIIFIVCVVGIIISRLSTYSYLKYLGGVSVIVGGLLFTVNLLIPNLYIYIEEIPYVFQNLVTHILDDSKDLFLNKSIIHFIIGAILITLNIIIYYIKEKMEDRKINKEF